MMFWKKTRSKKQELQYKDDILGTWSSKTHGNEWTVHTSLFKEIQVMVIISGDNHQPNPIWLKEVHSIKAQEIEIENAIHVFLKDSIVDTLWKNQKSKAVITNWDIGDDLEIILTNSSWGSHKLYVVWRDQKIQEILLK